MTAEDESRKPRVFSADDPGVTASDPHGEGLDQEDNDGRDELDFGSETPMPSDASSGRGLIGWGGLLVSAMAGLGVLAAGLWFSRFVSVALARDDLVGWVARGFGIAIVVAIFALTFKEAFGFWRLERLRALRRQADAAIASGDVGQEKAVVSRLRSHVSRRRDMRWDVERFREEARHMREPGQLMGLADRVLLSRADTRAKVAIYKSARRVGVVTTVVPIAFVVVVFVLFENLRMVRRLAEAYGGRPGFFGGLRLFGWIISHIAATGAIALTDDLFGQFFGQDMLRRVSRKLGEGAFNGAMTARVGVAALDVCRPLPFVEAKRPRARHIFYQAFPEMRPGEIVKKIVGVKDGKENAESASEKR